MKDLLLFYYNEEGNDIPERFEEILELCLLNSHLFIDSYVVENKMRYHHNEFIKARSLKLYHKERVGIIICGIALYYVKQNDTYNSNLLFELALPSDNIVALVGAKKLHLSTDTMVLHYNEMIKICEDMINSMLITSSFSSIELMLLNNIVEQKELINTTIKKEKEEFDAYIEYKNKTTIAIKEAIDLATFTFDFDIESFYNTDELAKLL